MNSEKDEFWMARALELAQCASDRNEVPVGALVVLDDEIIGEGFNQPISMNDPCAHAEILALRSAAQKLNNYRLPGAWLYVTIEPCTMCFGAVIHSRIDGIVFGAHEPKAGVLESFPQLLASGRYNHFLQWRGGVRAEQCSALMQGFFKRRRHEKKQR